MDIKALIKSRFKNVEIKDLGYAPMSIEVTFREKKSSVIIAEDSKTKRYSASYSAFVHDGQGGWKIEEEYSENMLIDGVFWILRQIERSAMVMPEIVD